MLETILSLPPKLYNEGKQSTEGQGVTYSSSSIRLVAKSGLEPRSSGSNSDPLSTTSSCNSSRNCASSPGSGSSQSWGSSMSWYSPSISTFISQLHRKALVAWLEFFSSCLLFYFLSLSPCSFLDRVGVTGNSLIDSKQKCSRSLRASLSWLCCGSRKMFPALSPEWLWGLLSSEGRRELLWQVLPSGSSVEVGPVS